MRFKFIALAAIVALAGCATINNPVTNTNVYEVEAAYDAAVLTPLSAYAKLPLCASGTHISVSNPCHEATILATARGYDRQVQAAFAQAIIFARDNPTLDASAQLGLLNAAIAKAEAYINSHQITLAK